MGFSEEFIILFTLILTISVYSLTKVYYVNKKRLNIDVEKFLASIDVEKYIQEQLNKPEHRDRMKEVVDRFILEEEIHEAKKNSEEILEVVKRIEEKVREIQGH